jgi:hypothetical protein
LAVTGPQQASTMAALGPGPNTLPDYMQMSRLLASTVGQDMMQFTQAVMPQAAVSAPLPGQMTTLDTGKRLDRDQIAKLKGTSGISMAKEIPHIWSAIQSTKGKTFDTYCAHLAKLIDSWCRTQHIERDKSIYLPAKFFKDHITLRFNLGGPVAQ